MAATVTGVPKSDTTELTLTPSPTPGVTVAGGGILSFPKYELTVPEGWSSNKESQTKDDERLTLTNGEYSITITQGGFGGSVCLFPGDADFEGPSVRYDNFKDLKTKSGDQLRRTWTGAELEANGYGICQNTQYGWGAPTMYGHIAFITPKNPSAEKLVEMDNIISSISKI